MNKIVIPPNSNWFAQSICHCTSDGGLMYGAMTKIVYIPPKNSQNETKTFDLKNKVFSFTINPNWTESQSFAVLNSDLQVLIYDFNTGDVTQGHRGHENEQNPFPNRTPSTAITFLRQNVILSSVNSNVIHFNLATNNYKIFFNLSSKNPITIMKQSPKESNLLAAGTKNGLILLIAIDKMQVLARLREHDMEICSLDWLYFKRKSNLANVSLSNLIADSSDCFDIYEDRRDDDEFGVARGGFDDSGDEVNEQEIKEKIVSNTNFDFLEACKSLKDQILTEPPEESEKSGEKYEANRERYGLRDKEFPAVDDSVDSNASSRTPHLTSESDEAPEKKEFVFVSKEDVKPCDEIAILASGSSEEFAWLWNVDEKISMHKISWHPKKRQQMALPAPFTNVMWIDQDTLIITDANGELIEFKINLDFNTKKITSKENKEKKFDARGVLNLCKNSSNFLWTSSIHRHISCIDLERNEKVVHLDTIQLRIHYIAENLFDSNLIAVAGNDTRICLWNTSQTTQHEISLRAFMNKIKCTVLCLSWHPVKENLLAFSTREGRIGILDVNKSSNVPVILPTFTSKPVYSISWAKQGDDVLLLACDRHKFVTFSQSDGWKIKNFKHLHEIASIAVNGEILALGTEHGLIMICKIDENFTVLSKKKLCKKYIGMMAWNEMSLVIACESGFYYVKNLNPDEEIKDENLIHVDESKSRIFSVKFNKLGSLIVSGGDDGLVRIWDVEKCETISSFNYNSPAFGAIFMPKDENFVICGGQESTVIAFAWKNHHESAVKQKKKGKVVKSIQWATPTEVTTIAKNSQRRQKKKIENVEEELSKEVEKISLTSKKALPSLFTTANRELTVNPLAFIESILMSEEREKRFHEIIFTDRENVKKLLDNEISNKKSTSIVLPQLNDTIKDEIFNRISNKTLTETHVAIAPSISYDLWKRACLAFAQQSVENGDFITSIPYFLAVNEVNSSIFTLCDGNFYREAWIIAKMRKLDGDTIFNEILSKWLNFLTQSGSFESIAALLVCKGDYLAAAENLEKRQIKTEKHTEIINALKMRHQSNGQ